jgi:hypothetical protein
MGVDFTRQQKLPRTSKTKELPPVMNYINSQLRDSTSGDQAESRFDRMRRLSREFCLLPESRQAEWTSNRVAATLDDESSCDEGDVDVVRAGPSTRALIGLPSERLPVNRDAFARATGADAHRGFNAWGVRAQDEYAQQSFVEDRDEIPKGSPVTIAPCCAHLHFGVCQTADKADYDMYVAVGIAIFKHLWDSSAEFSWVRLYLADNNDLGQVLGGRCKYVWVAHLRGSNPRMALLLPGERCRTNQFF